MRAQLIICLLVWPAVAHGPQGLQSSAAWVLTYDKLYEKVQKSTQKNWTLKLHARDFPFTITPDSEQICFESDHTYRPPYGALSAATPAPHCCFVTAKAPSRSIASEKFNVKEIQLVPLAPRPTQFGPIARFQVKFPENIFEEFYCSSIVDESQGATITKSHLPSLAEINSALNLNFGMTADEI